MEINRYIKFRDKGWFTYYVNVETGEKKFKLDDGDVLIGDLEIKKRR